MSHINTSILIVGTYICPCLLPPQVTIEHASLSQLDEDVFAPRYRRALLTAVLA